MLDTLIRIRSDVLATNFEGVTLSVMVMEGNVVLAHFTSTFVPKVFDLDELEAEEKKATIEKLHSGILKQPFLNTIGDEIGQAIGVLYPTYQKIERPLTRLGAFCFADVELGKIYFDRVNDDIDHRILYECHVTKDLLLAVLSQLISIARGGRVSEEVTTHPEVPKNAPPAIRTITTSEIRKLVLNEMRKTDPKATLSARAVRDWPSMPGFPKSIGGTKSKLYPRAEAIASIYENRGFIIE